MSGYESPTPDEETTGEPDETESWLSPTETGEEREADRPGAGEAHAREHTPAEASTPTYESAQADEDAADSGLTPSQAGGAGLEN